MDRKEFLSTLGITAVGVLCTQCLGGCQNPTDYSGPTNVDFTLNLADPAYQSLAAVGGYIYKDSLIVAHVQSGGYVAVSAACTHSGTSVYYDSSTNLFHCPSHGSNFAIDGSVRNGPAGSALTNYHTSLSGTSLRVYS